MLIINAKPHQKGSISPGGLHVTKPFACSSTWYNGWAWPLQLQLPSRSLCSCNCSLLPQQIAILLSWEHNPKLCFPASPMAALLHLWKVCILSVAAETSSPPASGHSVLFFFLEALSVHLLSSPTSQLFFLAAS